MVDLVVTILKTFRVGLYELAGGGLLIAGVYEVGGRGPAMIAGAVCALAKSLEHDLSNRLSVKRERQ